MYKRLVALMVIALGLMSEMSAGVNSTHKALAFYDMVAADADFKGKASKFLELIARPDIGYEQKVKTEVTDDKPVVLFIPTTTAFSSWKDLAAYVKLADSEQATKLKQVLKYHVYLMGGSKDLMTMQSLVAKGSLEMASGDTVTAASETTLKDKAGGTANIVGDVYEFKHGFIYFIDKVLIPTTE